MGADPPDKSDLTTVSTDNIDVTGVVDGGLQFSVSAGELDVTGDGIYAYIDFQFGFHVSVLDPLYKIKDASLGDCGALFGDDGDGVTTTAALSSRALYGAGVG